MRSGKRVLTAIVCGICMLTVILDTKTAINGAMEGIELCIYTLIPSLFPLFVLSIPVSNALTGIRIPFMKPVCRLCEIPEGAESLFLLGILGGYPVGAQAITHACEAKQLSPNAARRLMGFCSNAGPAFLFGIAGSLFTSAYVPWLLWLIHIVSALIVGMVLPGKGNSSCTLNKTAGLSIPQALEKSIRIMASVCGWVILFKVILEFCERWFLWLLPKMLQTIFCGILELSNGCISLHGIAFESERFILCAAFLGFGGLCVAMQTVSVTASIGTGMYFPGKAMQAILSIVLADFVKCILYPNTQLSVISIIGVVLLTAVCLPASIHSKKTVAFPKSLIYNKEKSV